MSRVDRHRARGHREGTTRGLPREDGVSAACSRGGDVGRVVLEAVVVRSAHDRHRVALPLPGQHRKIADGGCRQRDEQTTRRGGLDRDATARLHGRAVIKNKASCILEVRIGPWIDELSSEDADEIVVHTHAGGVFDPQADCQKVQISARHHGVRRAALHAHGAEAQDLVARPTIVEVHRSVQGRLRERLKLDLAQVEREPDPERRERKAARVRSHVDREALTGSER